MIIIYFIIIAVVASIGIALYQNRKSQIEKIESCREHYPYWFKQEIGMVGIVSSLSSFRLNSICKIIEKNNRTIEAENRWLMEKSIEQQYASTWRERESIEMNADIMKNMEELVNKAKIEQFQEWCNRQNEFAKCSREHKPKRFGCASCDIKVEGVDENDNVSTFTMKIWNHFAYSICEKDIEITYSHSNKQGENTALPNAYPLYYNTSRYYYMYLIHLMKGGFEDKFGNERHLPQNICEQVIDFINDITVVDKTIVYVVSTNADFNHYLDENCTLPLVYDWHTLQEYIKVGNNVIIVAFKSCKTGLQELCNRIWGTNPYNQCCISCISVFYDYSVDELSSLMENETKKDEKTLGQLLDSKRLICPSLIGWNKTGVVRLFLNKYPDSFCIIVSPSYELSKQWDKALSEMGIHNRNFRITLLFSSSRFDNLKCDLLVFDYANQLPLGRRAEIVRDVDADYVLTLGSVSDEDKSLLNGVWITKQLQASVISWDCVPQSDLRHYFFIRYYPTTCDFDATDEEWNDRQLIWSFKNDPDKNPRIPYQEALDEIVPRIEEKLKNTFGKLLSNLTLVCIPASSPEKNKARYEYFSDLLCRRTGMTNAYSHIIVNAARVARHVGGAAGDLDTITFDDDFFKGKNVLLFDDVLTRGDSMRKYRTKMIAMGANVIAGLTVGKTCHTREYDIASVGNIDYDDFPY